MDFIMTLFTVFQSVTGFMMKKQPGKTQLELQYLTFPLDSAPKEEFCEASSVPGFSEADLLSSCTKKVRELEEKADILQAKPSEMPTGKEELLNAAVRRVDALEAELITTKRALYVAVEKQEELLAYIDRLEQAKFRKKKLQCF